ATALVSGRHISECDLARSLAGPGGTGGGGHGEGRTSGATRACQPGARGVHGQNEPRKIMTATSNLSSRERWESEASRAPRRPEPATTVSGVPVDMLYT